MAVRKRNEFLDGDESEEDVGGGYASDDSAAGRGGIGAKVNKRQKREEESDEESAYSLEDDANGDGDAAAPSNIAAASASRFQLGSDFDVDELGVPATTTATDDIPLQTKKSTPKSVARAEKAARKSGVIYISRVPPFMKPQTLRHLLSPHASKGLGRIFLTPEDHTAHLQRVKRGGNKKKSFTDGWVEFTSKTEAKIAAEMLNGNIIGGKKGGFYHDDMWNIKYLRGFKWSHLTDQIAGENAERAARLREEVRRTKEENRAFVEDVERGKMLEGMERKRKLKVKRGGDGGGGGGGGSLVQALKPVRAGREFEQRKAREKDKREESQQTADQKRVLSMIL